MLRRYRFCGPRFSVRRISSFSLDNTSKSCGRPGFLLYGRDQRLLLRNRLQSFCADPQMRHQFWWAVRHPFRQRQIHKSIRFKHLQEHQVRVSNILDVIPHRLRHVTHITWVKVGGLRFRRIGRLPNLKWNPVEFPGYKVSIKFPKVGWNNTRSYWFCTGLDSKDLS